MWFKTDPVVSALSIFWNDVFRSFDQKQNAIESFSRNDFEAKNWIKIVYFLISSFECFPMDMVLFIKSCNKSSFKISWFSIICIDKLIFKSDLYFIIFDKFQSCLKIDKSILTQWCSSHSKCLYFIVQAKNNVTVGCWFL